MTFSENTQKKHSIFQEIFTALPDPRRSNKGNYIYPLEEILFLTISGVLSGMDGWTAICNFGKIKLDWLRTYYPFKEGIPSHDVLGSLFARLDPDQFNACFIEWVNTLSNLTKGEVIAFDGKTIRNSDDKQIGKKAFHVVSAYAASNRVCLGQYCVDEKSNEITAIPKLLDLLMVKDAVVTIDAMGCQQKIAAKIIDAGADYLLMVKDNQKLLKQGIQVTFGQPKTIQADEQHDIGHGRAETRTCQVTEDLSFIQNAIKWKKINSLVKIISERTDKQSGKSSTETRYYISSLKADAGRFNQIVREHWRVENNLHWTLDVIFKEDHSLKKKGYSALNFNMINKVALTLIEKDKGKKSKILKRQSAALDDKYRAKLLGF